MKLYIREVTVLGAGVMGAQIAAVFANIGIKTNLLDLPAGDDAPNALVDESKRGLTKLKPAPLVAKTTLSRITAGNFRDDLAKLRTSDLIIEAVSENFEIKQKLYQQIVDFLAPTAILASNTSGLSINDIAKILPENLRSRFLGVHFFNPPRYMKLLELIPHIGTSLDMVDALEAFAVSHLGKGVIIAKDTPNFIGNRVGVFALLSCLHHADKLNLTPDVVDLITGPILGRPKSATYRTLDVVGLDTFSHVVNTMAQGLENDPWHESYKMPDWIANLIGKGSLGAKSGGGIYKKIDGEIKVYDSKMDRYRARNQKLNSAVEKILKIPDFTKRYQELKNSDIPEAKFLWLTFCDLFHYSMFNVDNISHNLHDIDYALRWGYGFEIGPLELAKVIGIEDVMDWVSVELEEGNLLATAKIPYDVVERFVKPEQNVRLSVYQKQYYPDNLITEHHDYGKIVIEANDFRLWTYDGYHAIFSFKTKNNTITSDILLGIQEATKVAKEKFEALILWQPESKNFSYGANLKDILTNATKGNFDYIDRMITDFQFASMALQNSEVPTIAAVTGLTLGGGCEFALHVDRIVASIETYIGLVELGVGVIPAGGGTKEFARLAGLGATRFNIVDRVQQYFNVIANATLANNAYHAKELNYLDNSSVILANPDEVLHVAHVQAEALNEANYKPRPNADIMVAGVDGIANIMAYLANLKAGNFISEFDYKLGSILASVICGGEIATGSMVSEQYLLDLEREAFVDLVKTPETQARIKHTLETGKPLRN